MRPTEVLEIMADALEGLRRSEVAEPGPALNAETVLFGARAVLDSIGFVTFIAEAEDRLSEGRDTPIELVLTEIWEFSAEEPSLTAGVLANYCAKRLGKDA